MSTSTLSLGLSIFAGALASLSTCGTTNPSKAPSKSEGTTEQPAEVSGGFGLNCSSSDNPQDATKTDFSCVFINQKGEIFKERPDIKLAVEIKVGDQVIPVTLQSADAASNFTFTVAKTDAENVQIGAKFINPLDGNKILSDKSAPIQNTLDLYQSGLTADQPGPDGSTLTLQSMANGFKVWKDKDNNRILNASGRVSRGWQKKLNRNGIGFTNDDLPASDIQGRVCPKSVFIDTYNMTATACLYYDSGSSGTLDFIKQAQHQQGGATFNRWDDSSSGRAASSSWYEGNITPCADKGMRLPTLYEVNIDASLLACASAQPTGDGISDDQTVDVQCTNKNNNKKRKFPAVDFANGVPPLSTGSTWTASASSNHEEQFYAWQYTDNAQRSSKFVEAFSTNIYEVRCVIPNP